MTFIINTNDKKYYYGDFIAPAINLGLASKIYLVTLKKLLKEDNILLYDSKCSIRMESEFINDPNSFDELKSLFENYVKNINFKLSFEVTDSFAIHNTNIVKQYAELFEKYDFGFGINSFTGESKDYSYLKTLNPEFIKSDCSFLLDQPADSIAAIQGITDSLSIDIIATFVKTKEQLDNLSKINIDSIQGPITDMI
jgi:EAL domain-containing protein (putative c-di-GMP-specific phosphodiesterase class I)